ncbi:MAG: DNA cytosine methyltransferase [Phycisphaerales bacterium]
MPADAPPNPTTPRTAAEFFAGMGLVRRALESLDSPFKTLYANDIDPLKHRLYAASFPDASDVLDTRDIHHVRASDIPPCDLWSASFPCTDLSLAGARAGIHQGQSAAVWQIFRLLNETHAAHRPRWLLFENVLGLLTSAQGADFLALVRAINDAGYAVDPLLVDAAWFTAQSRPRLYLLCDRIDVRTPPALVEEKPHAARNPRITAFQRAHPEHAWSRPKLEELHPRADSLQSTLEDPPQDSDRWWTKPRADYFVAQLHPAHRVTAQGMIRGPEISHATAYRRVRPVGPQGAKRSVAELRTDGRAGCLRLPKGGSAKQIVFRAGLGQYAVRHMTPKEAARLQGVEDDALFGEGSPFTDNELLAGLGDAVCVPAAAWAAEMLTSR